MSTVRSHEAEIYYERYGSGPALVFAHGAGGNAASWWQQVPHFARHYSVIVFDHRCFARSVAPAESFVSRNFADDVLAIMDKEKIERGALVCQSLGGWSGSRLAIEQPERIAALVMSHTPGCFSSASIAAERARHQRPEGDPPGQFGHWAIAPDYPDRSPEQAFLYRQLNGLSQFDRSLLSTIRDPGAFVDLDTVDDYRVPTHFITAEQDAIFPVPLIEAVARAVPGASMQVLGDAGHSSYFEKAAAFNDAVDGFLAVHWPGSA